MDTVRLGNSDMKITRVGFGSWAVGGAWLYGWSEQDDAASVAAIHKALEMGVNWIDTAAVYGLGRSEEVVARALATWSGPRPYVFTKCGMIWDDAGTIDYSGRRASIRREVEASLRRLKVDVIDLYQMHWPMDDLDETLEGWSEMAKLKDEGKLRWIGVSNYSREELLQAAMIAPVTSLQPPYSLIRREIEADVLPTCRELGAGVIVYSPMGSGMLTGKFSREYVQQLPADDWRRKNPAFREPALSANLAVADRVAQVARRLGRAPGEVAIAWTLRHPAVSAAIVGARNPAQVEGVFNAADIRLGDEDAAFLEGR